MLIKLYEFMPISLRICQHFLLRGDPEEIRVSGDNFCSPHSQVLVVPHTPKLTRKGQNCAMLRVKN